MQRLAVGSAGATTRIVAAFCVAVLVVAFAVTSATPAQAHAILQQVSPADGATLESAPAQVTLRFDEEVSTPPGGVRVFDETGARVDRGDAAATAEAGVVAASLEDSLGEGTYVVTWRVTSADGHPLRGAWLFTVGEEQADTSLLAEFFAGSDDRGAAVIAVALRWLLYGAAFLAGGGALVAHRLGNALGGSRGPVRRLLVRSVIAAVGLTAAAALAQVVLVTGLGFGALTDLAAVGEVLSGGYGLSALVRLLGLAMVGYAARSADRIGPVGVVGGLATVASFALEGHTVTSSPVWLVATAGVVHLVTAAVWSAGLVVLAVAIGRGGTREEPLRTAQLIAAFSGLATWTILGIAIAGAALSWVEVRALRALTSTTYGWTLVAKLLLLVPVAVAAMYNNRRLVPAVTGRRKGTREAQTSGGRPIPAGGSDGASPGPDVAGARADAIDAPTAVARLRRSLRIEIVGIVAVLAATALLVGLQPAAEAAGISGAYSTYAPLGEDGEVNITVDPNRVGRNEIHLYVLGADGRQVDVPSDAVLSLTQPERNIGPLRRETTRLGPGHFFLSGPELSVPGRWEIEVEVPTSRFDVLNATVPVTVNPG